jgi:hypothetical protein
LDAANENRWGERLMDLRDITQQCYLLIPLTKNSTLKNHLLELGLEVENQIRLIETELERLHAVSQNEKR